MGSSSFIFSHINTHSHWASPLRPPKKAQKSSPSSLHSRCSSQQLAINPHYDGKQKKISSHNSPSQVHSGINPSRPWLLEVPDRSSRTSFVLHAHCCKKQLPTWGRLKEALAARGQMSSIFRLVLFSHCKKSTVLISSDCFLPCSYSTNLYILNEDILLLVAYLIIC